MRSGRPLLLSAGLDVDYVEELEYLACQELDEAITPLYIRLQNVYARRC